LRTDLFPSGQSIDTVRRCSYDGLEVFCLDARDKLAEPKGLVVDEIPEHLSGIGDSMVPILG
jgi:hypothetical protein